MLPQVRLSRLKGAKEANRLHSIMEVRANLSKTNDRIDVFGVLADLEIRVVFKSLDGLLGMYMRGDCPGVMISTKRQLSVQRFTAAHELGHAVLEHRPSLDSPEVLRRAAEGVSYVSSPTLASWRQEVEADAFASEFLIPEWLIIYHAVRQGWNGPDLSCPDVVYQLSLRVGASYDATARALHRCSLITYFQMSHCISTKPKSIKSRIKLSADWSGPWADVWLFSKGELGSRSAVSLGDLIAFDEDWTAEAEAELTALKLGSERHVYRADVAGAIKLHPKSSKSSEKEFLTISVLEREKGLSFANRARLMAN